MSPGMGASALFVDETDSAEGPVLGATQVAVKCSLALHLFAAGAPGGKPALAEVQEDHGFADDAITAREDCLGRVAGQLVRVVAAQLRAPPVSAPFVTVELDIVDPGAVEIVLEACRRIGSVVATEPRRIMASAAELRVFSPMTGPALQLALVREIAGKLAVVPIRTAGDTIYLQLRNPDLFWKGTNEHRELQPLPLASGPASMPRHEASHCGDGRRGPGLLLRAGLRYAALRGVATLRVECNVPGAEVILNDVLVGQASELEHGKAVRPGTYRVEIRHPSYYSYFGEITLGNGGAAVVKAALHPLLD